MPAQPSSTPVPGVFAFDDFEVDIPAFELRQGGVPVAMEPQVFEVLAFLVENAGRVLTKDEILDRVWPERYVSEASLNSRVMSARKALGDSGSQQRYIKTVHGRGYRFVAAPAPGTGSAEVEPADPECPRGPGVVAPARAGTAGFFGREQEIARIRALLAQPGCRLLTITGPGGIGKTSLACETLARSPGPGDARFVALEHVEPLMFAAAVASALGIQPGRDDIVSRLVQLLRQRPAVIVLDNLEHLVEEARPVIEAILAGAPGARFVVTSRTTLGLASEWVLRIEGLALEAEEGEIPAAARLFMDRATRANAGAPPPAAEDVLPICELVDGMPLAVEIAASLVRYLPLAEIREVIERDAAGALATHQQSLPERHRSVRALFEASLGQLTAEARETLQALSVFEGPFRHEAAEFVAGATLPALMALVDASLLKARDGRFSLHPLLRQYLRCPGCGVPPGAAEAHAAYFASLVERHAPALNGRGQLAAVEALGEEVTNIVAAWRWIVANRRVDLLERARHGLFTFLTFRARFLEAKDLVEAALPVVDEAEHPATMAGLLVHHTWVLMRIGQPARAAQSLQRAIQLSKDYEVGWLPGFGSDPRFALVAMRVGAGEYAAGYDLARHALALAEAAGDQPGIAFASWLCSVSLYRQADIECYRSAPGRFDFRPLPRETRIDECSRYLARAIAILEPDDEHWLRAYVETERGLVAGSMSQRETGIACFRTSYSLRRKLDDPQGMASALMYLSDSLIDMGHHEEATRLHDEMRVLLPLCADATGHAELLRSSGIAAAAAGNYAAARELLRDATETSRALGFANNVTGSLRALGEVFLADGQPELGARIMQAVAAHTSTTPGSRAKAHLLLREIGREVPPTAAADEPIDDLVDEAMRAAVPLESWLGADALASSAA